MVYLGSNRSCQPIHINQYVQYRFASIRIEISDRFAEFVNVIGEQLVRIRYSIIQIGHFIKCESTAKEEEEEENTKY